MCSSLGPDKFDGFISLTEFLSYFVLFCSTLFFHIYFMFFYHFLFWHHFHPFWSIYYDAICYILTFLLAYGMLCVMQIKFLTSLLFLFKCIWRQTTTWVLFGIVLVIVPTQYNTVLLRAGINLNRLNKQECWPKIENDKLLYVWFLIYLITNTPLNPNIFIATQLCVYDGLICSRHLYASCLSPHHKWRM